MKSRQTVSGGSVTKSQPAICISVCSGSGQHILQPTRSYPIRNRWGGVGVSKKLDGYGMNFPSSDAAWRYAYDHGYIKDYFKKGHI